MKIVEILGGHRLPVSLEENKLLDKLKVMKDLKLTDLDEREQHVAESLVRRNIVNISNNTVVYNGLQLPEYVIW